MTDDTNDDEPERVPLTKVLDELFVAAEEAMEDIKDGIEQADEDHPLDDDSPFERLREQMRTTERQGKEPRVEINIEDELDAIREEEGVEAESVVEDALSGETFDEGQDTDTRHPRFDDGWDTPPADARFCPSCGDGLPAKRTAFFPDELLGRYRAIFHCPSCGYDGEVIRHGVGDE